MYSSDRRFPKNHSMLTLGLLVLAGVVITTVARAEPPSRSYLAAAALSPADRMPSRHVWLLPSSMEGRLEVGAYRMRFLEASAGDDTPEPIRPVQLRLSVGDPARAAHRPRSAAEYALMSDSEREQQRVEESLFSMSFSRSW